MKQGSFYVVESIVDSKIDKHQKKFYLIKWENWPHSQNTWEPIEHLTNIQKFVDQFDLKNTNDNFIKKQLVVDQPFIIKKAGKKRKIITKPRVYGPRGKYKPRVKKMNFNGKNELQIPKRKAGRPKRVTLQTQIKTINQIKKIQKEVQSPHPLPQQANLPISQQSDHKKSHSEFIHIKTNAHKLPIKKQIVSNSNLQLAIQYQPRKTRFEGRYTEEKQKEIQQLRKSKRIELKKQSKDLQTFQGDNAISAQNSEQSQQIQNVSIQQVLLHNMNYKDVVVTSQEGRLLYQIPYKKNGQTLFSRLTSTEIMKVSPGWLIGFFQGFYY